MSELPPASSFDRTRRFDPERRATLVSVIGGLLGAALGVVALIFWLDRSSGGALDPLPVPGVVGTTAGLSAAAAGTSVRSLSSAAAQGARADAGSTASVNPSNVATSAAKSSAARPTVARVPSVHVTPLLELTDPHEWPAEPESPETVDDATFVAALELLCGPYADKTVGAWYAPWLLRAARENKSDPFLLGALMFFMSGCESRSIRFGSGLTGLDVGLYRADFAKGRYRYRAFEDGVWSEHVEKLKRFPFNDEFVKSPESNLYFAAAFLPAWSRQASGLRAAFVQPSEYRHYVSHFVWGDRVLSHREEDAILAERRRLLEYYGARKPVAPVRWRGFELGCPLDGCPRLVTSTLGDARDGGARLHAGNDFESTRGEPVRAVADGLVVFAGVDLPGRGAASKIPIWAQRNVDPETMGAGGLYVCIDHGESKRGEKLVSCYMHLEAATVVQGRELRRGEQVGRVGTSGIKQSKPHLHFELHSSQGVHRATELLKGLALGHPSAHAANAGAEPRHAFAPDANRAAEP